MPSGVARLDTSITNPGTPPYGYYYYYRAVGLFLVDPEGRFAASSSPGGAGNYGDVQVSEPIPGTWTALIFSAVPVADGGITGPVLFGARIANWVSFGRLSSRSLTLAPGAARTVTLTARTPANPGDRSGAIVLTSSAGGPDFTAVTTVPVTLRALVPSPSPTSTFRGTLTGGNGIFDPTATAFYQMRIPAGLPVLNAQITLPNSGSPFEAALIDPATQEAATTAVSSLYSFDATGNLSVLPERGVELHVLNPDAGVWTLIINWYEQVSGTALRQPFTVVMSRIAPVASAPLLPDSAANSPATWQACHRPGARDEQRSCPRGVLHRQPPGSSNHLPAVVADECIGRGPCAVHGRATGILRTQSHHVDHRESHGYEADLLRLLLVLRRSRPRLELRFQKPVRHLQRAGNRRRRLGRVADAARSRWETSRCIR